MTRLLLCALLLLAPAPGRQASARDWQARAVLTGGTFEYVIQRGDTLDAISARFGAGVAALVERNGIQRNARLVPGELLSIDNRHIAVIDGPARLTINLAQRMLFFADGNVVWGYPVAVGLRSWPTPVGAFTVIDKEENPTWDVPLSIQEELRAQGKPVITSMPPSPANPLGKHWIRLSLPSIGIHGTIAPSSVYRYASHGCLRMHPDDVAALYARVPIGAIGVSVYRPLTMALIEGRVFLEAHADVYRRAPTLLAKIEETARTGGYANQVDWAAARRVLGQKHGIAVDVTKDE
ncbi:MAG: L,D-transpeptidase family protein [Vicinamibacterales bacterium]